MVLQADLRLRETVPVGLFTIEPKQVPQLLGRNDCWAFETSRISAIKVGEVVFAQIWIANLIELLHHRDIRFGGVGPDNMIDPEDLSVTTSKIKRDAKPSLFALGTLAEQKLLVPFFAQGVPNEGRDLRPYSVQKASLCLARLALPPVFVLVFPVLHDGPPFFEYPTPKRTRIQV